MIAAMNKLNIVTDPYTRSAHGIYARIYLMADELHFRDPRVRF